MADAIFPQARKRSQLFVLMAKDGRFATYDTGTGAYLTPILGTCVFLANTRGGRSADRSVRTRAWCRPSCRGDRGRSMRTNIGKQALAEFCLSASIVTSACADAARDCGPASA